METMTPAEARKVLVDAQASVQLDLPACDIEEKMIAQDMPAIPLWATPRLYGWSNRLKNVRMTPRGQLDLGFVDIA